MSTPNLPKISSYDHAVEVLGGVSNCAALLGKTPQQICQYRTRYGAFPPTLFLLVGKLLAARGYSASTRLFNFERPAEVA